MEFPPESVTKLVELDYRPAAMRVLYGLGQQSVTGFVIDFRRVREPIFDNMGLKLMACLALCLPNDKNSMRLNYRLVYCLMIWTGCIMSARPEDDRRHCGWRSRVDKLAIDLQQKA